MEADIISLHIPLTHLTKNMIRKEHLLAMKSDTNIINTSCGGIINEQDLYDRERRAFIVLAKTSMTKRWIKKMLHG